MIPIMSVNQEAQDQRQHQTWPWKEVRLSRVPEPGSVTPKCGAVVPDRVDEAGQCGLNRAIWAGLGHQTHLPAVGEGASWIAEPVPVQFGQPSRSLVEGYPVGDYLAATSTAFRK